MNPDTKWIWKNGEHNENTWMCFVKKVRVEKIPQTAVAKIAVDSKYWLYINGSLAVFEGGVKRGPTRNSTYYDEIDIAGRLRAGENTIAVLVWYFGKNGFCWTIKAIVSSMACNTAHRLNESGWGGWLLHCPTVEWAVSQSAESV
ncbi:MAG: hypothetical protein K2O97_09975 [Acetatifactor sp.]|nr:hypothetical protein [Acetatifactor sp.]